MKKFLFSSLLFITNLIAFAQVPALTFEWVKNFGSTLTDVNVYDIKNDQYGNVYFCGSFSGTLTLQDSSITSVDTNDIYFAKLDSAGNLFWLRHIGGIGYDVATSLAIDTIDNTLYVAGTFYQKITLENDTLTANTYNDFFLIKYDYYGNYIWSTIGGNINLPATVVIDKNQNIVLVSQYEQNLIIGDTTLIYPSIGYGLFIVKYSKNGTRIFAKLLTEYEQYNTGKNIAIDNYNNIIICSNGGQIITTDTIPYSVINIVKYDSNGVYQWALPYGENFYVQSHSNSIAIDKSDNIYMTGEYFFDQDAGIGFFICKASPDGNLLWESQSGSNIYPTYVSGLNILSNTDTTFFVTLFVKLGNEFSTYFFGGPIFENGVYIAQFDSMGNYKRIKMIAKGLTNFFSTPASCVLVPLKDSENTYFASTFTNTVYLNDTSFYVPNYYTNIFITKVNNDILLNEKNILPETTKQFLIYPNPADNFIEISLLPLTENFVVEIFNIYGQPVNVNSKVNIGKCKINIKAIRSGLYLIKITDKSTGTEYINKFVKY